MAIQVNGTQVIGNSRELTNIASIDATTAASITAAGIGGGGGNIDNWDPTSTPDVTMTSSGTWTNPNTSDDTLVVFYAVGAGASGSRSFYSYGGGGGGAVILAGTMGTLPSSISITVGAGPTNESTDGGATTITASGKTHTAPGGDYNNPQQSSYPIGEVIVPTTSNPFNVYYPVVADTKGGPAAERQGSGKDAIWGGGGGGGGYGSNIAGGTSAYAGNGGIGSNVSPFGRDGQVPGGGGGGSNTGNSSNVGNGANGSVRIWYITA